MCNVHVLCLTFLCREHSGGGEAYGNREVRLCLRCPFCPRRLHRCFLPRAVGARPGGLRAVAFAVGGVRPALPKAVGPWEPASRGAGGLGSHPHGPHVRPRTASRRPRPPCSSFACARCARAPASGVCLPKNSEGRGMTSLRAGPGEQVRYALGERLPGHRQQGRGGGGGSGPTEHDQRVCGLRGGMEKWGSRLPGLRQGRAGCGWHGRRRPRPRRGGHSFARLGHPMSSTRTRARGRVSPSS